MPRSHSQLPPQRFEQVYRESCEIVERAHERAEAASARARQMRERVRAQRATGAAALARLAAEDAKQAAVEKERFVAVVSHELRQPLNAALTAFSLLEADTTRETAAKASRVIGRQLLHMAGLLDDLLDLSRLSLARLQLRTAMLDLRRPIESAVEMVASRAEARGQRLTIDLRDSRIEVLGDAARLQQVFANLLSNAIRYTPEGGEISLEVERVGDHVLVRIRDSGRGMEPDELARIFEPFERGATGVAEGLGIGLTLVRGIVELHGGRVAAESPGAGRGSIFTVTLPVVR
jgi:signal transduction histidine kinase